MKRKKKTGLEKRLTAYAAAAAGVLAMTPAAEAAVHYSGPKDMTLSPQTSPITIDLNNDGANDFRFSAYSYAYAGTYIPTSYQSVKLHYSFYYGLALISPTATSGGKGGSAVIGTKSEFFYPAKLNTGYQIRNSLPNYGWSQASYGSLEGSLQVKLSVTGASYFTTSYAYSFGNFNNSTGCLGVRFKTDGGKQLYGWIRFQGTSASSGIIKDWAYEDSGGPIAACVVPEEQVPVNVPTLNQWGIMVLIALLAGMSLKGIKKDKRGRNSRGSQI